MQSFNLHSQQRQSNRGERCSSTVSPERKRQKGNSSQIVVNEPQALTENHNDEFRVIILEDEIQRLEEENQKLINQSKRDKAEIQQLKDTVASYMQRASSTERQEIIRPHSPSATARPIEPDPVIAELEIPDTNDADKNQDMHSEMPTLSPGPTILENVPPELHKKLINLFYEYRGRDLDLLTRKAFQRDRSTYNPGEKPDESFSAISIYSPFLHMSMLAKGSQNLEINRLRDAKTIQLFDSYKKSDEPSVSMLVGGDFLAEARSLFEKETASIPKVSSILACKIFSEAYWREWKDHDMAHECCRLSVQMAYNLCERGANESSAKKTIRSAALVAAAEIMWHTRPYMSCPDADELIQLSTKLIPWTLQRGKKLLRGP